MEKKSVLAGFIMCCMCATGFMSLSGSAEAMPTGELVGQEAPDMPPTYYFDIFTNNGMYSDTGEFKLFVEVTEGGTNQVAFKIINDSDICCSVAAVYFDDGGLLSIADVIDSNGTDFEPLAAPHDLPAGNELIPPFETTEGFSVDPDNQPSKKGINPGECLTILFSLKDGFKYEDVLSQLDDQSLRIGAHVIAFPDGSSESAVTPEPATMIVLGLGGLVLCIKRRRAR